MKASERERRDWMIIPIILLIGFLSVTVAGQWALRFSPNWKLNTNMGSNLDPNGDFLTRRPSGFIEPVDPSILTEPIWINLYLTPGASFFTGTPFPKPTMTSSLATSTIGQTAFNTPAPVSSAIATYTAVVNTNPTNTLVYYQPPASSTSRPKPSATSITSYTSTPTSAVTISWTFTPTTAQTATATNTATSTPSFTVTPTSTSNPASTATPTSINTPDLSEPDFGGPDGNATTLANGSWVVFNLSGFALDGSSSWDVAYYEQEETSSAGKIHLGAVQIDVYDQTTSDWYTIYNWGDGIADTNASYNNGNSEPDGFPIDKSLLYGAPPLNTGIAIDLDTPALGQGATLGDMITQIRITSLSNTKCDIDSLQMLR